MVKNVKIVNVSQKDANVTQIQMIQTVCARKTLNATNASVFLRDAIVIPTQLIPTVYVK